MESQTRSTLVVLSSLAAAGALAGCGGSTPAPAPSATSSTAVTPSAAYTVPTGFGPDECPFVDTATLAAADPTGTFSDPSVTYVSGSGTCSFVFALSPTPPTRNGVVTLQLSDGSPAALGAQQAEVYAAEPAPDLGADSVRLTGLPESAGAGTGEIKRGFIESVDSTQSLMVTLLVYSEGSAYTAENVGAFADAIAAAVTLT